VSAVVINFFFFVVRIHEQAKAKIRVDILNDGVRATIFKKINKKTLL